VSLAIAEVVEDEETVVMKVLGDFKTKHPHVQISSWVGDTIPSYRQDSKVVYPPEFSVMVEGNTLREAEVRFRIEADMELSKELSNLERLCLKYPDRYGHLSCWRLSSRVPSKFASRAHTGTHVLRCLFSLCVAPF